MSMSRLRRLMTGMAAAAMIAAVVAPASASPTWVTVVNDQFDGAGVPTHWLRYDGRYGSDPHNCAVPSHVSVSGGSLHLLMRYEGGGRCGAAWYTAGVQVARQYGAVNQRVTVRFRVVSRGVVSHRIIPMRFPDSAPWPQGGEEDFCEGSSLNDCSTFLHYGSAANTVIARRHNVDLAQWHTVRFERYNNTIKAYFDDMYRPNWTYSGSSSTLPGTLKRTVLQQECRESGCPSGKSGTEDIQIDWIKIENPR